MAKGQKTGGGSRKGVPNKATANAREAIAAFVEGNVPRLNGLLDEIEQQDGPQAAWNCIVDVLEYHVPKLQRVDNTHSAPDGSSIKQDITVRFV